MERLQGFAMEQHLQRFPLEEPLQGLAMEGRLQGFATEQLLQGLPMEEPFGSFYRFPMEELTQCLPMDEPKRQSNDERTRQANVTRRANTT